MVSVSQPDEGNESVLLIAVILLVILFALIVPILGWLYLDILAVKHETKAQIEKVERLRRDLERDKRDKKPDSFSDNPVFDRVRRPLSLSMPRPSELGKGSM